ncbi:Uncharacterised protein [Bordetella pertussis]|nr:Uncharacterised protein [Bordetella pertussis]
MLALAARHARPHAGLEGAPRGRDGLVDIGLRAGRHFGEQLAGGRVDGGQRPGLAIVPAAVDEGLVAQRQAGGEGFPMGQRGQGAHAADSLSRTGRRGVPGARRVTRKMPAATISAMPAVAGASGGMPNQKVLKATAISRWQ